MGSGGKEVLCTLCHYGPRSPAFYSPVVPFGLKDIYITLGTTHRALSLQTLKR